ncbi:DUF7619 domain-containing protein [Ferruginibacter albus]|uniref:DUF7619 domain-containing protein n=1 Tax=Ferruginibacter albus TaxID=2875540 RepID=UPI001CC3ACF0|nr:T9SS type A sorting domain-containing protein [Ferruginibacter albus]UAY53602.1 hypothetical protein K9M53_08025 [Ferruginibacter albus]
MKRNLSLLFSLMLLCCVVKAQYVTIPDNSFRLHLQTAYPSCFNEEGKLDTTCSAILNETTLYTDVDSLFEGVQYFKALKYLYCNVRYYGGLPENLPNSITYINCSSLYLTSLPKHLPNSLTYLDCSNTHISNLPAVLPSSLTYLNASSSSITSLPDNMPASLITLNVSNCSLTNLPDNLPGSLLYLDCSNNYKMLDLTESLPNSITHLDINNCILLTKLPQHLPNSLTFLNCSNEAYLTSFPALPPFIDSLECSSNTFLLKLPTLPNSLRYLNCTFGSLTELPTLPNSLVTLLCSSNYLTSLPALPNSLKYLDCDLNSQLEHLPLLPDSLQYLNCSNNVLLDLPALPNSLSFLNCQNNKLTSLPSLPNALIRLICDNNKLTSLPPLPMSLQDLWCGYNNFSTLPKLPDNLIRLECIKDSLTTLPALPSKLASLYCSSNKLTSLPALPISLISLLCQNNKDLYCLPLLPDGLDSLGIGDDGKIHCLPNHPLSLSYIFVCDSLEVLYMDDSHLIQLPLCNPTNNINHCTSFPVLNGKIFYDNNSNGVKDTSELYHPYIKLNLSNNRYTFSNTQGYYEIGANYGNYQLSVEEPNYYKAAPASVFNYNFISYDTLITQDIALQPTKAVDSLSINIIPNWSARPGFAFPCIVNYSNVGTTTINPVIAFTYDSSLLVYDSSSNHSATITGNKVTVNESSFVPGAANSFTVYLHLKTTDTLGSIIHNSATASVNAAIASNETYTIVRGAYDPNEKEATTNLTPQQVAAGKAINYVIRFQNTGTDTAFNIVVSDTLSSALDASSLQMIASSAPCKVTVDSNIVFFEFLNVLLPDSNVNKQGSNGYVSFSIKPKAGTSSGSIQNKAAIYFDYNAPVITNTAVTTIAENTTVPVKLISFKALNEAGSNNALLYWNTANEINTKQYIIEESTDGVHFDYLATETAKGSQGGSYSYTTSPSTPTTYYRLKIIDNDGRYSYSSVVSITRQSNDIVLLNNPAGDVIFIKNNAASLNNTLANIINSNGGSVQQFTLKQGRQSIDVRKLATGTYYIKTSSTLLKVVISR